MIGPIPSLVAARARGRGLPTFLSVSAVAVAVALVLIVAGIGAIAAERTVQRALAADGPDRPVVRVTRYTISGRDWEGIAATADEGLAGLAPQAGPVVRGVLVRELVDLEAPAFDLVVAIDDPAAWTTVLEGRLPAPCTRSRCEAILASETPAGFPFHVAHPAAGLELPIVGRGLLDPAVPFPPLDQSGPAGERPAPDYQTERRAPAILLVNGVDAIAAHGSLDTTGRTYVWTLPLRPDAIEPWTAAEFRATVASTTRQLADDDSAFSVVSPVGQISAELSRADAASSRLLLIGSLAVAILLAFCVFAALVGRTDATAELARLRAVGARRRDLAAFVILEALVPVALGTAVGAAGGIVVVAGLIASQGSPLGPLLAHALLAPGPLLAGAATVALAVAAIGATTAPALRARGAIGAGAAIATTTVLLLGWQLAGSGALDPAALARSLGNPAIVVLPPAVAFAIALAFLSILPVALRWVTRRFAGAPLPVRLALLSVSRDPARPAATLTLLAFSLGAIVFAVGWSASLRQGIEEQAAYRSGLDLRVVELGTGLSISQSVVPVDRYAALGEEVDAVPVYRAASDVPPAGRVEVIGLSPSAIPTLTGWRSDFADDPIEVLAERLEVPSPSDGWHVAGHRLPHGETQLRLRFRYVGDPLRLAAIIETADGDHARVMLGTITEGMTEARAPLPPEAVGGTLIALGFTHDRFIYGSDHQHDLRRATVAFEGLDGLVDETPRDLEVFTVAVEVIRAPQATDGLVLPAIVSPDLAGAVDPDGVLRVEVGGGATIPLRVVGTARAFPTVVAAQPRFVVVPLEPYLVALNAEAPGAGRPSEMWLGASTTARAAAVRNELAGGAFRFPVVTDRAALVAAQAEDPLSRAIVWALVAAALAGLALSVAGLVLGAATDLRDEQGELADLEAQGVPPSALVRQALVRTALLALGGAGAGLAVGILLTYGVTASLALTAEGTLPIPPLRITLPIVEILAMVVAILGATIAAVAWLATRSGRHRDLRGRHARRWARRVLPPTQVSTRAADDA